MFASLAAETTVYDYAQSEKYNIEEIKHIADIAISRDKDMLPMLVEAMRNQDPLIRYWGALGAVCLRDQALPAKGQLLSLLDDENANVRIAVAEAVGFPGEAELAVKILGEELIYDEKKDNAIYMFAANALQYLDKEDVKELLPGLEVIAAGRKTYGEAWRIADYLVAKLKNMK